MAKTLATRWVGMSSNKGEVRKSTLDVHLAVEAQCRGGRVPIFDPVTVGATARVLPAAGVPFSVVLNRTPPRVLEVAGGAHAASLEWTSTSRR